MSYSIRSCGEGKYTRYWVQKKTPGLIQGWGSWATKREAEIRMEARKLADKG